MLCILMLFAICSFLVKVTSWRASFDLFLQHATTGKNCKCVQLYTVQSFVEVNHHQQVAWWQAMGDAWCGVTASWAPAFAPACWKTPRRCRSGAVACARISTAAPRMAPRTPAAAPAAHDRPSTQPGCLCKQKPRPNGKSWLGLVPDYGACLDVNKMCSYLYSST